MNQWIELLQEVFLEACTDSVKMLPFLFGAYLLIEYIERHQSSRIEAALAGGGRWGFIPGAVLGCVPQCGFSAVAANLYGSKVITLGTLVAVFLATSDEAVPLLFSMPSQWPTLGLLLAVKVIYALLAGILLDFVLARLIPRGLRGGYSGHIQDVDCHEEHEESGGIWLAALRHTLEIFLYILAFSILIDLLVEGFGQERFAAFLTHLGPAQPLLAALVGLLPNCAASVLLTELYLSGSIQFSSVIAGLCSGAGVGLAVLFRANPSLKQNLFITGLLWAMGAFAGVLAMMAGL